MDTILTSQEVEQEIFKLIAEKLGIADSTLSRDTSLYDDLNASKLEMADIIQTIEEKYQLKFAPEQLKSLETVAHILDLVIDNVE